jgi:hypothetical protein
LIEIRRQRSGSGISALSEPLGVSGEEIESLLVLLHHRYAVHLHQELLPGEPRETMAAVIAGGFGLWPQARCKTSKAGQGVNKPMATSKKRQIVSESA